MNACINKKLESFLGYQVFSRINETNELIIEESFKYTIVVSSLTFCILCYFLSNIIFSNVSVTYRDLKHKDKMFWSLAVVRGVYGCIGAIGSIYERYFDEELWTHITKGKTELSYLLVASHLGFFLFEWSAQIYFDAKFKTLNKTLHAHHLIAFLGYSLCNKDNISHYFAITGFVLEMSTPFSCICFCLIKSNLSETLLWKANQFVLIHVFHMRSMVEFKMIYEYLSNFQDFSNLGVALNVVSFTGPFVIGLFLTPYWTYRKTEQLFSKSDWSNQQPNNETEKKKK